MIANLGAKRTGALEREDSAHKVEFWPPRTVRRKFDRPRRRIADGSMGTLGRQPLLQRASSSSAVPHTARILQNVIAFVCFKLCSGTAAGGPLQRQKKDFLHLRWLHPLL
jgi:hypothetical protein